MAQEEYKVQRLMESTDSKKKETAVAPVIHDGVGERAGELCST